VSSEERIAGRERIGLPSADRELIEIGAGVIVSDWRKAANSPAPAISPRGIETEMPKHFVP
jgi:hypothetical protein